MELLKRKTFWVGLLTMLAGLISGLFAGGESGDELAWPGFAALVNAKVIAGLALITGRDAIRRFEPK